MRIAVVGHVEWVEFVRVERVPVAGEITQSAEAWCEPGGGGAVAAVQLARLAGSVSFFTAVGDDELGRRCRDELTALGLELEVVVRDEPQRRAVVFLDSAGERTITLLGRKLVARGDDDLPWPTLSDHDAVYFTGGDEAALRAARGARVLVATARELPTLQRAGVQLDALVRSALDRGERYRPGALEPTPRLVVATEGADGVRYSLEGEAERRIPAAALPGPRVDSYGSGDSFAGALTFALAERRGPDEALRFASRCAARALTRRGAYGGTFLP